MVAESDSRSTVRPGRWVRDVSDRDVLCFLSWLVLLIASAATSTAVIVHHAEALQPADLPQKWLLKWAITSGLALVLLAFAGGLFVFGSRTKWQVALTWPWLGGIGIGVGYYFTLAATNQLEPGGVTCSKAEQDCNIAMGFGAALLSVVAAVVVGGIFVGVYALRRLVRRTRSRVGRTH